MRSRLPNGCASRVFRWLLIVAPLVLGGCAAEPAADRSARPDRPPEASETAVRAPEADTTSVREAPAAGEPEVRPAEVDAILAAVGASDREAVVVNVWATWCLPCREEFPDLMRLHRQYRDRGVELVLVSADFADRLPEARRFLKAQGVDFPSFLKVGDDMEFIDGLSPKWSGALPATFVYERGGKLKFFHEGKVTYAELEQQLLEIIPRASRPGTEERS